MVSPPATSLWRAGPADKPVLCNACGMRYRHQGSLDNYFPKHCRSKETGVSDCGNVRTNGLNDKGENDSNLWKPIIPSKRRSLRIAYKRMSPMEKFHKELLNELNRQEIENEFVPEEVLIFENVNNFIPSNEIGLGAVLLKKL